MLIVYHCTNRYWYHGIFLGEGLEVAHTPVPGGMCAQQGIERVAQLTKTWAFHDKNVEPRRFDICIWRRE